jgi:hypothetical protein
MFRQAPALFWKSANRIRTVVAVLIMLAAVSNRRLGKLITARWEGIPGKYVWMAIGAVLLWGIMKAIYERDADLIGRLAAFQAIPTGAVERRRVAESQLEQLDELEKNLLKQLLLIGMMNEGHAVAYMHEIGCTEVREFLAPIGHKTNFLIRNFVGYYEINSMFREVLEELLVNS